MPRCSRSLPVPLCDVPRTSPTLALLRELLATIDEEIQTLEAEIVRAGIESIERGQMDASKALGMTNLQAMRLVILPQAVRVIVPPTGNEFIAMLKNSSLASVVSYPELLFVVRGQYARNYRPLELLTVAAIWYLFFSSVFSILQAELAKRGRANLDHILTPPLLLGEPPLPSDATQMRPSASILACTGWPPIFASPEMIASLRPVFLRLLFNFSL